MEYISHIIRMIYHRMTYKGISEDIVQCISRQKSFITVNLIEGQFHPRDRARAVVSSAERLQEAEV